MSYGAGSLMVAIAVCSLGIAQSFERGDGLRGFGRVVLHTTHALTGAGKLLHSGADSMS